MKKFTFFFIFIFFTLTYSRTLLVPEEFLNIQQAVVVAQNGDTVSMTFGRSKGQRITVTTSRIWDKTMTFEVRGEGKEKLLETIKDANNPPNTNSNPLDSGWTEQAMVNRPDSSLDIQPHIEIDNSNYPWVVWQGSNNGNGYHLSYTKWDGSNWLEETVLFPPQNEEIRYKPRITFDTQGNPFVIYHKSISNNNRFIYFTRWNGNTWEPETLVHEVDTIRLNFSPRIEYGGGQIWCCWYGNVTDRRYKIYVSRWNGNSWEPKTQISPPDTSHRWHWWCDIAVDSLGLPHVVWATTGLWEQYVFYRTYDGTRWLEPETLNNPQIIRPVDWIGTGIVIDKEGNIHVSWAGYATGGSSQDIYYSRKENGRWLEPVQINRPDTQDDFYPDIIAKGPDDIWIGWNKELTWGKIYVSHFDGYAWSAEERLDNESISYDNISPELEFRSDEIWATWTAYTVGVDATDIYYSCHLSNSIKEVFNPIENSFSLKISSNPFKQGILITYAKESSSSSVYCAIFDLKGQRVRILSNKSQEPMSYKFYWDGKDGNNKETPDGVYVIFLKSGGKEAKIKILKIR